MKYIPLSDNDPKNINRMAEEIYNRIGETEKLTDKSLTKTPDHLWAKKWGTTSTDSQRLTLIAEYLGIIKTEG